MRRSHDDYTIGWICALPLEMAAAKAMLDEVHDNLPVHQLSDHNSYILGNIKEHNIVIACLPSGDYGLVSANTVAMQLLSSFHSIRFGLMVGIGGGVPNSSADIRLGDVVISKPTDTYGGVVQYDYGKALGGGGFQRTGMLSRPPQILLTALSKLQANHLTGESKLMDFITGIEEKFPLFARPTQEEHLYLSDYDHIDANSTNCTACDPIKVVWRPSRGHNEPLVHYGLIASANKLIRDSQLRDRLSRDLGAYCVEMEAAGLMNNYPCLVIRGICDYADSHKNKEWQGYASAVAAAYAKELILCTPVSNMDHTRSAEEAVSVKFKISFNLNGLPAIESFLGRQKELERLWHHLRPQNPDSRKVAVLHGMGGIGKTQLAIRFARDHKDYFTAILWLNGKSRDTLLQSLSSIQLPGQCQLLAATNHDEVERNARQILRWFATPGNSRWLLIFDNVDQYSPGMEDGYDIKEFFPAADHGSILITSRLQSLTELGGSFPVPVFNSKEAILLLEQSRHVYNPEMIIETDQDMIDLVNRLGGLPLAITIAGAFMRETNSSIREYLQYYEDSWHDLQSRAKPGRHYEQGNLLQTWLVSYDEIRKRDPSVAKLMLLLAHFDNRDIWYELVKCAENSSNLPICLVDMVSDALTFKDNMRTLNKFSLIEANQQSGSYSIHPVVQDWCLDRARIDNGELNIPWSELAVIAVGYMVYSTCEPDKWSLQRRLLVHADFVWQKSKNNHLTDDISLWSAFNGLGLFYNLQGKPNEAEVMFQRALAGYMKTVGPDHIHTLDTVGHLGNLYRVQGKLKEAEIMHQQALTGYKNALGPGNRLTLHAINNLGYLYRDQGRFKEAEMISQQVQEDTEKALELDITPTSDTVLRLGELYRKLGNPNKAEMMHQRVLASYEKALGPDHPSTLSTMKHLADDYQKQGKLKEAEMMCQRALAGYEKVLGSDHLSTLAAVDSLGVLYIEQEKLKEVEILYQESLANREKALGPDHPSTLSMMNRLAISYRRQRELEKAEIMYQQALAGYEKTLGLDHLSTLDTIRSLGWVYSDQGRPKEAEIMYQRALAGYEMVLGPSNPTTKSISQELRNHRRRVSIDFWFWRAVAGFLFLYYVYLLVFHY